MCEACLMGHSRSLEITLALLTLPLDGSYEQAVGGEWGAGGPGLAILGSGLLGTGGGGRVWDGWKRR